MGARYTIYSQHWRDAERRVPSLPEPLRSLARDAAEHIERGWRHIEPMAALVEARLADLDPDSSEPDAALHHFVDGEVADLFRGLAINWWAGVLDWEQFAPDDLDGDLSLFRRYLLIAEMASRVPGISPDLRAEFVEHTPALARWCDEAAPLFYSFVEALP
ncbi:MAG TPA: hypothetical protein VFX98_07910 [Longimicrobiaceae bacterium]|nr:hypothetical protein [Longimicrobiaceae bacterium]